MMPIPNNTTPTMSGLADLVIEDLAAEGAALRARIRDLETDLVTYRELLQTALAVTADLTKTHERMRTSYYQLLDERRAAHPTSRAA